MNGKSVFANSSAAQVLSSLNGVVLSVLGLNNAVVMHGDATVGVPNYLVSYDLQGWFRYTTPARCRQAPTSVIAIFGSGDM